MMAASFSGEGVAADLEAGADRRAAVAHLVAQPEDAEQVDVALDDVFHFGELDAVHRRDVADAGGQAGRQPLQQQELSTGLGPLSAPTSMVGVIGIALRR